MNEIQYLICITVLYFIYGLAFYSMGLAMLLETRRVPLLAGPRTLHPFSMFFFINGIANWVEVVFFLAAWRGYELTRGFYWLHFFLLLTSFSYLSIFSVRAINPIDRKSHPAEKFVLAGLIVFYLALIVLLVLWQDQTTDQINMLTRIIRYCLAIPGALMAALALWRVSHAAMAVTNQQLRTSLRIVSICFVLFGVSQIFVSISDWFVVNRIAQFEMGDLYVVSLQCARTALALMMTLGLIRVSQLVEDERLRQFDIAEQARLEAMRRIENELVERESMRRELLRHIVLAQEDERARIARELHDETAQFLTAFSLNLATLQNTISDNLKLDGLLESLQNLSKAMAQGIHRMVYDLRPAQLDDLGLAAALQTLADEKRMTGLDVRFEIDGQFHRLDPIIETVIFRIAQEALTNVVKHAQSPRATLQLHKNSEQVTLRVFDQGIGFEPHQKLSGKQGWGLVGMRERAESVGGLLQVYSATGEGTLVEVIIPLNDANDPEKRSETHDEYNKINVSR